jgi:lipid-A-disaccharide synthase
LTSQDRSIFVSSGEVSGDHYLARTCRVLRDRGFAGRIYGLVGAESRGAGLEAVWDNSRLHVMGFTEVIGAIRGILRLKNEICRDILKSSPSVMVVVDSPDFHLPLIRSVRRGGYRGRIIYISPPSAWAWRKYRARDLARHVDVCLPLFKFEHDYLEGAGCATRWAGYPLVGELSDFHPDRELVLSRVAGPPRARSGGKIAALLPGSRKSEIFPLYPVLSKLYEALEARGHHPVFSVAPGLSGESSDFLLSNLKSAGQSYYEGPGRDIMAVSDVAAGASGTATAEALLLRRYMVVMYKLRPMSAVIGRILLRGVRFAIPNILAGEMFYPELLQERANPEDALAAVSAWLDLEPRARRERTDKMERLVSLMGCAGAYEFWADAVLEAVS